MDNKTDAESSTNQNEKGNCVYNHKHTDFVLASQCLFALNVETKATICLTPPQILDKWLKWLYHHMCSYTPI